MEYIENGQRDERRMFSLQFDDIGVLQLAHNLQLTILESLILEDLLDCDGFRRILRNLRRENEDSS